MKEPSKHLRQQQATEQTTEAQTNKNARIFATVEEVIREDASQTEVPEVIEQRLKKSLREEPPSGSWWRRMFSK